MRDRRYRGHLSRLGSRCFGLSGALWFSPDGRFVGKEDAHQLATIAREREGWIFSLPLAKVIGQRITFETGRIDGQGVRHVVRDLRSRY